MHAETSQVASEKSAVDQKQPEAPVLPPKDGGYQFENKRKLQKGKSRRDPSDEGSRMLQRKSVQQTCKSNTYCIQINIISHSNLNDENNSRTVVYVWIYFQD